MIPYRAMLDVPAELPRYLSPGRLAIDHGISRATAYRYIDEAVDVLSAQAPGLDAALQRALADGAPYVILDGKIFETDRLSETVTSTKGGDIDAWYSGKKNRPGGASRPSCSPAASRPGSGPAQPGHVRDITAARACALPALYRAASAGMPTLADGGYEGAGIGICVPVKNPPGNCGSTLTRKPETACSAASKARENEDSPCLPSAGPPSSASLQAPEEPPR